MFSGQHQQELGFSVPNFLKLILTQNTCWTWSIKPAFPLPSGIWINMCTYHQKKLILTNTEQVNNKHFYDKFWKRHISCLKQTLIKVSFRITLFALPFDHINMNTIVYQWINNSRREVPHRAFKHKLFFHNSRVSLGTILSFHIFIDWLPILRDAELKPAL